MPAAIILGCAGPSLDEQERRFFRDADPLGFILFARNIETPEQVRLLTNTLRNCVGRADAPILIDQEGGRVARLRPPLWPAFPPASRFAAMAGDNPDNAVEACRLNASLIGYELSSLGIDVNCAPVLDVPVDGAHDAIGDRAFGRDPPLVAALGRSACKGLMQAGVIPVVKHMPGQGRARVDSHHDLPTVTESQAVLYASDFMPFKALADMPWGMVAHVRYSAIDRIYPASTSPTVIRDVIRGKIGFQGILIADDISMQALSGSVTDRALATLAAGLDLTLHCNGDMVEMTALMAAIPETGIAVLQRLAAARTGLGIMTQDKAEAARSRLAMLAG